MKEPILNTDAIEPTDRNLRIERKLANQMIVDLLKVVVNDPKYSNLTFTQILFEIGLADQHFYTESTITLQELSDHINNNK